jgi:hypothetical protein
MDKTEMDLNDTWCVPAGICGNIRSQGNTANSDAVDLCEALKMHPGTLTDVTMSMGPLSAFIGGFQHNTLRKAFNPTERMVTKLSNSKPAFTRSGCLFRDIHVRSAQRKAGHANKTLS